MPDADWGRPDSSFRKIRGKRCRFDRFSKLEVTLVAVIA